jgi:2-keto-3-deoxy-6-phosphogluconate aldolase
MAVVRAHPVEIRKALEAAQAFTRAGIDFVAVPVTSEEQKQVLAKLAMQELEVLLQQSEEPNHA